MNRTQLQHAAATVLGMAHRLGLDFPVRWRFAGRGAIFMLHSVVPDRRPYLNMNIHVDAAFLDRLLVQLRAQNIAIVTLDEALRRLGNDNPEPFVCFTLDDGYADNLLVAAPIFARHKAPFTVYVVWDAVTRKLDNWWACLREVVKVRDEIILDGLKVRCTTFSQKAEALDSLSRHIRQNMTKFRPLIDDLFRQHNVSATTLLEREMLSAAQVRELVQHPLATIGAHTVTHCSLALLSEADAVQEMNESRRLLEGLIDQPVVHLCYPYGTVSHCGRREFDIASSLGFSTATTTRMGTLFPEHFRHPTALPRINLRGDLDNLSFVDFLRNGGMRFLQGKWRQPVVVE